MPQLPPKANSASVEDTSVNTPEEKNLPEQVTAKLSGLEKQLAEEKRLREQILNDPDMRAVLEAKKSGKPIKFASEEAAPVIEKKSLRDEFGLKPEAANRDDFNKMSNAELLEILSDSVETYVGSAIEEAVAKSSNVLGNQFKTLQDNQNKLAQALIEQAKRTGADMMSKQYQDFNTYQEDAMKLVETHGLTLEDAYILAKSKKAASVPPVNEITSERPSIPASRRPFARTSEDEQRGERVISTSRRFKDLVSSAAENALNRSLRRS